MEMVIEKMIPQDVTSVVILGHIRPDGDCVGSCLGLYHYLKDNMPALQVEVCLQPFDDSFGFLKDSDQIQMMDEMDLNRQFDLCISCDASDRGRLGAAVSLFDGAAHTICIDHHITNTGFGDVNYIKGELSSACEVLGQLFSMDKISKSCAECLYLGVVHDTGVLKYSNTTFDTMCYAGRLMQKGIDHTSIIDNTFYGRTAVQTMICGRAMSRMMLAADGRISYGLVSLADMEACGADSRDLDGIVDQFRIVKGVEAAVFVHEMKPGTYKVSLRSNQIVDVSRIAAAHGGGGHKKAAGFEMNCSYKELIQMVIQEISEQLPA